MRWLSVVPPLHGNLRVVISDNANIVTFSEQPKSPVI